MKHCLASQAKAEKRRKRRQLHQRHPIGVVKKIKDKYGLTYSPLKKKYEDMKPIFHEKISQAIYGCKSWNEFSCRLACAGIDVKFHDDRNTGEHIGVKFSDGDITMNGSKIDRAFTYRRLNNLFELNRKQGQNQPSATTAQPKVTVQYALQKPSSLIEDVAEATLGAVGNLFQVGPGYDPQEAEFIRSMRKKKKKQIKPRFSNMADLYNTVKKQGEEIDDLQKNVSD